MHFEICHYTRRGTPREERHSKFAQGREYLTRNFGLCETRSMASKNVQRRFANFHGGLMWSSKWVSSLSLWFILIQKSFIIWFVCGCFGRNKELKDGKRREEQRIFRVRLLRSTETSTQTTGFVVLRATTTNRLIYFLCIFYYKDF